MSGWGSCGRSLELEKKVVAGGREGKREAAAGAGHREEKMNSDR